MIDKKPKATSSVPRMVDNAALIAAAQHFGGERWAWCVDIHGMIVCTEGHRMAAVKALQEHPEVWQHASIRLRRQGRCAWSCALLPRRCDG